LPLHAAVAIATSAAALRRTKDISEAPIPQAIKTGRRSPGLLHCRPGS
jgi:hypothetical protein